MARKSRKENNKVNVPNLKPSFIQTAAYVRLSLEDRNQKGSSIENQQLIIQDYIEKHPEFQLCDTYIEACVIIEPTRRSLINQGFQGLVNFLQTITHDRGLCLAT